jgi:hypothetical protein
MLIEKLGRSRFGGRAADCRIGGERLRREIGFRLMIAPGGRGILPQE